MAPNIGRRAAAGILAAAASYSPDTSKAALPVALPSAIAVIAGGFTIPKEQYQSYADLLAELNIPAVVVDDRSSLFEPMPLEECAERLLSTVESEVDAMQLSRARAAQLPLVLLAHSRGAKAAVIAASLAQRPVAAMVLWDPVDATIFEKASILPTLRRLNVPTAVCGSGVGGECAPVGSNYLDFFNALGSRSSSSVRCEAEDARSVPEPPRLLAQLRRAGHMQYVDKRERLLDVCAAGQDEDAAVREVALSVTASWIAAFVPGVGQVVAGGGGGDGHSGDGGNGGSPAWMRRRRQGGLFQFSRVAEARSLFASYDHAPARAPQTIGTGRASGSYLLLARRTCEACGGAQPYRNEKARAAQCLSVLEDARFGADVQFSVDEEEQAPP